MLYDSVIVVAVLRTCPQAIPLAMITLRKFIYEFPFLSYKSMGLHLAALCYNSPCYCLFLLVLTLLESKISMCVHMCVCVWGGGGGVAVSKQEGNCLVLFFCIANANLLQLN